jgi:hypothetical protein
MNTCQSRFLTIQFFLILVLSACASAPYQPTDPDSVPFRDRAQTQSSDDISVTAAVPGADETRALFDIPLYDSGIQPIWLQVENRTNDWIRYAPVGTDREYFSPEEVAYVHKGGFSGQGRTTMFRYFYDTAMPRRIPPGETRSGFVFTHAHPGTKAFNVDLFGASRADDLSFTFFIDVPGFQPDHSEAYFDDLYEPGQVRDFDQDGLRAALETMDHQTRDQSGQRQGLPINAVVVGEPQQILQALIRARWVETSRTAAEIDASQEMLFGRIADVVFRKNVTASGNSNELHFWLSPMRENNTPVWLVQVTHHVGEGKGEAQLDPDLDDAAAYFMQDMWYGQGLAAYAWVQGPGEVPYEAPQQSLAGDEYFTSGQVVVAWLSGPALSMLDMVALDWDEGPGRAVK